MEVKVNFVETETETKSHQPEAVSSVFLTIGAGLRNNEKKTKGSFVEQRSIIDSLMYASTGTRSDITFGGKNSGQNLQGFVDAGWAN